ncbi:RNA polymerase sigma factor [Pedobacter sp. MC2016-24]|uniref:RNA polymerase sigma factor n=1 Tax=Pedobacter sp. MC2016-24 TaxID=2780090 RepID=UPI001D168D9E|nr:RNA polymerase sigma-70 factor [Pedobacter sp. MC2016-24]
MNINSDSCTYVIDSYLLSLQGDYGMASNYESTSDTELVDLLRSGNRLAYTEIYNRYKIVLHTHAYKWMRDREEARDMIHELFTFLWDKRADIQFNSNLSGYLYVSLRNKIFNRVSRKKIESAYVSSLQSFIDEGNCVTDHLVRGRLLAKLIEKEIAALPPKMREVFELSRKYNLSHKEIAEQLGLSDQTVRKHIQHALKILRTRLGLYMFLGQIMMAKYFL